MLTSFRQIKAEICTRKVGLFSNNVLSKLYVLLRSFLLKVNDPRCEGCNASWHVFAMWNIIQGYEAFDFRRSSKDRVIVRITNTCLNSGIADRIRTMLTAYVLASEAGKKFYIYHDLGFKLEDYLLPNEVNWRIDKEAISDGLNKVEFLFFLRKFRELHQSRECHVYASQNVIDNGFLPDELNGKYSDHSVFNKLFVFHPRVVYYSRQIMEMVNVRENEYVAVHIRFLNFFEDVEIGEYHHGTVEEKEEMISSLAATLRRIYEDTGKYIVLFSDSNTYLALSHPSYVRVLPGKVGHVVKHCGDDDITLKAFSDLYIMSRAITVYSIIGENIYDPGFCSNGFSRLGAHIGNLPFIRYPRLSEM